MRAKIFTIEEANELIPEIKEILDRAFDIKIKLNLVKEAFDFKDKYSYENPKDLMERMEKLSEILKREIAEIEKYGCIVKDIETGLIDFYSIKDNKLIFLCWKHGENEIKYWHSVEDGFKGRKPLKLLKN